MSGIVGQNLGRGSGLVKVTAVVADSVTGSEIADDAIDSEHYTDGSIDNAHIADDAIDSEHYAAASIDNAHLADDAVDSDELAAGSVDTAHIADNQVTLAKMAGGTDGNIISYDASGDPVAISTGSDGQVLTSTGAGSPPAFEAISGGGIENATIINMTANLTLSAGNNLLTANLAAYGADGYSTLGDAVTVSSGVYTFPQTGYWMITAVAVIYSDSSAVVDQEISIQTTTDNSTYDGAAFSFTTQTTTGDYNLMYTHFILDVTNTTNCKAKVYVYSDGTNTVRGESGILTTYTTFVRLAAT